MTLVAPAAAATAAITATRIGAPVPTVGVVGATLRRRRNPAIGVAVCGRAPLLRATPARAAQPQNQQHSRYDDGDVNSQPGPLRCSPASVGQPE